MNQFSEEDRRLAIDCIRDLNDNIIENDYVINDWDKSEKIILKTVIKKKNEQIQRLEELLANAICFAANGCRSDCENAFKLIQDLPFIPNNKNKDQARELVKGVE